MASTGAGFEAEIQSYLADKATQCTSAGSLPFKVTFVKCFKLQKASNWLKLIVFVLSVYKAIRSSQTPSILMNAQMSYCIVDIQTWRCFVQRVLYPTSMKTHHLETSVTKKWITAVSCNYSEGRRSSEGNKRHVTRIKQPVVASGFENSITTLNPQSNIREDPLLAE